MARERLGMVAKYRRYHRLLRDSELRFESRLVLSVLGGCIPLQIDYRPKAGLKAICKGTSASSAPIF
jgi:hypothetical protein